MFHEEQLCLARQVLKGLLNGPADTKQIQAQDLGERDH